jgi:hypothetical protein
MTDRWDPPTRDATGARPIAAPDAAPDDDAPLDPAASAAIVAAQRARVAQETDVDGRLLFGAWGVAWLLGFGAMYAVAGERPLLDWPPEAAGAVFGGLLVTAAVITAVHIGRRTSGVHGDSAAQGAMYGWSWFLGFAGVFALSATLVDAGADPVVVETAMTVASPLVVGVLYMAGAAIWRDRTQFALGVWIVVVTIGAAFVGMPWMLAVMALAGGGGMLAGAVAAGMRRRRCAPAGLDPVPAVTRR